MIGGTRLRRRRGLWRDQSGVTAIEFGLLAVPFFSIIGAILETSVMFLSGQILESAVQDVSRLIRTGQAQAMAQSGGFDIDAFRSRVCERVHGLFGDCSGIFLSVTEVTDFASATVTAPVDVNCLEDDCDEWTQPQSYDPGGASSVILVQAYYKWPVILSIGTNGMVNLPDGKRLLGSVTVFRNEPF